MPGLHNVRNATGAMAMAHRARRSPEAAVRALGRFGGVARRFELRGAAGGVTFVDDYAHLPSEIAAVLEAAKEGDWRRVVGVFQPHRYSRMRALWQDFADAFVGADVLVITDVYPAGEAPRPGVTGKLVVNAVLDAHPVQRVAWLPQRADLVAFLAAELRPGDLCLSMGAAMWRRCPTSSSRRCPARSQRECGRGRRRCRPRRSGDARRRFGELTTYRVGGRPRWRRGARTTEDLEAVSRAVRDTGVAVVVLGRGSNILVADDGFRRAAREPRRRFATIEIDGTTVRLGERRACPCVAPDGPPPRVAGFEWAVGVPGSIGGAVRMNAGGHGSDMAAVHGEGPRRRSRQREGCRGGGRPSSTSAFAARRSAHRRRRVGELVLREGDRARPRRRSRRSCGGAGRTSPVVRTPARCS